MVVGVGGGGVLNFWISLPRSYRGRGPPPCRLRRETMFPQGVEPNRAPSSSEAWCLIEAPPRVKGRYVNVRTYYACKYLLYVQSTMSV